MKSNQFDKILMDQIQRCVDVLGHKADEYATADRLHNFKVAASLQGTSPRQALAGMMAKHSVSIYDMCKDTTAYTVEAWNEKITDHMNYLILLKAIIEEEQNYAHPMLFDEYQLEVQT